MNYRPSIENRKFTSVAVEDKIHEIKSFITNNELAALFENCFPNTLDTTIKFTCENGIPDTFIITGDINAMWLRDSSAQVSPYLRFVNDDPQLKEMFIGVINRQVKCILLDSYANAFTEGHASTEWNNDITEMKPGIHERKWEIDSLCYPVKLAYDFWKTTGNASHFSEEWKQAAKLILNTFKEQQRKENRGSYRFGRITHWSTDTVPGNGYGNPVNPVGLIVSIFRPSDDATIFPFLIPSNYFAVATLKQLSEIFTIIPNELKLATDCVKLAYEIENAISKHAVTPDVNFGNILAYEVDGFGNKLLMDDANVPSLLSLPYLGCLAVDDIIYQNTRKYILSNSNPYFFKGNSSEGIGSPHTLINNIWPMSIIIRALTSINEDEIISSLKYLLGTHAKTGFMHESFDKDNPINFTRNWFAWANSLFGELVIKLYNEKPDILKYKFN